MPKSGSLGSVRGVSGNGHPYRDHQKIYSRIETWRSRPIEGSYPYVYLDGIVLKRAWAGEVRNISVLVAIGVGLDGHRVILGVAEGAKEDRAGWAGFLAHLKERGLTGVKLIISDACLGLTEALAEYYPDARWQRCAVHFYRNVLSQVPRARMRAVATMLKSIHAAEDRPAVMVTATRVVEKLHEMKLPKAASLIERTVGDTLTYYAFPDTHWRSLRTIPWNVSCGRFEDVPVSSVPSPTAMPPSCWWQQDSDTSPPRIVALDVISPRRRLPHPTQRTPLQRKIRCHR